MYKAIVVDDEKMIREGIRSDGSRLESERSIQRPVAGRHWKLLPKNSLKL